jgi:hypothetical protein
VKTGHRVRACARRTHSHACTRDSVCLLHTKKAQSRMYTGQCVPSAHEPELNIARKCRLRQHSSALWANTSRPSTRNTMSGKESRLFTWANRAQATRRGLRAHAAKYRGPVGAQITGKTAQFSPIMGQWEPKSRENPAQFSPIIEQSDSGAHQGAGVSTLRTRDRRSCSRDVTACANKADVHTHGVATEQGRPHAGSHPPNQ